MKGQNFSFMKEMVPMILSGRKIITNRIATPFRQKLDVGGIMKMFTGMRTPNCKRIGTAPVVDRVFWWKTQLPTKTVIGEIPDLWESPLQGYTWREFAYIDGFDSYEDFYDYFNNRKGKADEFGFACYKFEFSIERLV